MSKFGCNEGRVIRVAVGVQRNVSQLNFWMPEFWWDCDDRGGGGCIGVCGCGRHIGAC